MNRKKVFLLIGIFWITIIGTFVISKEYTLRTGKEILLKTRPVDPRDLFRGDYVILRYDISQIDTGSHTNPSHASYKEGDVVFVTLDTTRPFAEAQRVFKSPPAGEFYIKGRIAEVSGGRLTVEYGIESYFVPEGKGWVIEQERNKGNVNVLAAVGKEGRAIIKKLLINGEEVRFE
ncbi:MAG: GDYXXLXY domain-containing protein [Candidatus Omnitrophota bacterium]